MGSDYWIQIQCDFVVQNFYTFLPIPPFLAFLDVFVVAIFRTTHAYKDLSFYYRPAYWHVAGQFQFLIACRKHGQNSEVNDIDLDPVQFRAQQCVLKSNLETIPLNQRK